MRYNFQAVKKAFSVCVIKKIQKKEGGGSLRRSRTSPMSGTALNLARCLRHNCNFDVRKKSTADI